MKVMFRLICTSKIYLDTIFFGNSICKQHYPVNWTADNQSPFSFSQ